MKCLGLLKETFERFRDAVCYIAAWSVMIMMFSINIDVVARNIGSPIYWVTDISLVLIVFLGFLAMGTTQAKREHIVVDFILNRMSKRKRAFFEMISWFLSLLFCLILLYSGINIMMESVKTMEGTLGIITFPIWPARIAIVVGLVVLSIQFVLDIISAMKDLASVTKGD